MARRERHGQAAATARNQARNAPHFAPLRDVCSPAAAAALASGTALAGAGSGAGSRSCERLQPHYAAVFVLVACPASIASQAGPQGRARVEDKVSIAELQGVGLMGQARRGKQSQCQSGHLERRPGNCGARGLPTRFGLTSGTGLAWRSAACPPACFTRRTQMRGHNCCVMLVSWRMWSSWRRARRGARRGAWRLPRGRPVRYDASAHQDAASVMQARSQSAR